MDRQPTDNEGLMERVNITGRERRREEKGGSPSAGKEPAVSRVCATHKHVNKPGLPKDAQLRYEPPHIQTPTNPTLQNSLLQSNTGKCSKFRIYTNDGWKKHF